MVAKVAAGLEGAAQPFVVRDVITNEVSGSHKKLVGWLLLRGRGETRPCEARYLVSKGTYSGISPVRDLANRRACNSSALR